MTFPLRPGGEAWQELFAIGTLAAWLDTGSLVSYQLETRKS